MNNDALRPRMSKQSWPVDGLERVLDCPICGSADRSLLYQGLSDRVFFVAPGEWTLWQCTRCRTAWLDPRPTEATIGIAYERYYTHVEVESPPPTTAFQRLRAALGNGYRNSRFGTHLTPALPVGGMLARLLPPLGWPVDVAYRSLPVRAPDRTMRVLDIGCGNGAWLELARAAGWEVAGAEPDPVSRGQAQDRGIRVRESVGAWLDQPETFDHVTVSHVIEHVHDPRALLCDCLKLLRPGGSIYVETPNIDALGHQIYGRDWLALDPPRHLILFNRKSLSNAIVQSGFRTIRFRPRIDAFTITSAQSRRLATGFDPFSDALTDAMAPPPSLGLRLRAMVARRHAEFLTLTAIKPR